MDKSNSVVRMIVCLVAIAVVTAALLAVVNSLTAPVILANNQQQLEDSLKEVMPADSFEVVKEEEGITVYEAKAGNETVGYCVVNVEKGYGGDVQVMTGVEIGGAVTEVKLLNHSETAGLGANAEKEEFIGQYNGKMAGVSVVKNNAGTNEIQAISGATITSSAVTRAVNAAIELAEEAAK